MHETYTRRLDADSVVDYRQQTGCVGVEDDGPERTRGVLVDDCRCDDGCPDSYGTACVPLARHR